MYFKKYKLKNYDYDKEDPTFKEDLEKSKESVDKAARFLCDQGFQVLIEPTFVRDDTKNMSKFSDNGDLKIFATVEVKHRPKIDFSSKKKFPFSSIIIDTCSSFDKKLIKPVYYIIWNASQTSFFFINVRDTLQHWTRKAKFDKQKNRTRDFYELDLKYCHLKDI